MKSKITVWILTAFIVLTSLPYWIAIQTAGPGNVFGGFLYNPIDGNSYLAKMVEGAQGSWQFYLPFTAEKGNGSYLFLFYIFLGHLSAWFKIAPIWIFHIARILACVCLVLTLSKFLSRFVPENSFRICFILAAFGSGLGWLGVAFRLVTSDLTVPEAYPFLSGFANPHFPLALSIVLFLLTNHEEKPGLAACIGYAFGGLALAILLPFAAVLVVVVSALTAAWKWIGARQIDWQLPALVALGSAPMILYQFSLTQSDPLLKVWNAQNLTPSPYLYDFILSFSPALILAIPGAIAVLKSSGVEGRLLVVWVGAGILLSYLPFGLQRRFLIGLFIPLSGLAGIGLAQVFAMKASQLRIAKLVTLTISIPTSIFVILLGIFGAVRNDPLFYLSRSEQYGMSWLKQSVPARSVILAAPQTSMYIPGHTGDRVVYGHPFETIDAEKKKAWVQAFYRDGFDSQFPGNLRDLSVDYVWVGPRERELGFSESGLNLPVVYQRDDVTIYQALK